MRSQLVHRYLSVQSFHRKIVYFYGQLKINMVGIHIHNLPQFIYLPKLEIKDFKPITV